MPFSRSRTWTASTLSLDIRSALQQSAAIAVGVRDRPDPVVGGAGYPLVVRPDGLAREALASVVRVAGTHARPGSEITAEVIRLGQRALRSGRRDLESRLHQDVAQVAGDALAE